MSHCSICDEATGLFTCRGCGRNFCVQHVSNHSELLHERMKGIIEEDDKFKQKLLEYTTIRDYPKLKRQIDEWEEQSIEKIQEIANDTRKQLLDTITRHTDKIAKISEQFTKELNNAYKKYDFIEQNFQIWSEKLENLKNELNTLPKIFIKPDCNTIPIIQPVIVMEGPNEYFQEANGNLRIEEKRKLLTHGCFSAFGTAYGRYTYSTGCYRFCFQIKSYNNIGLIFLGIISQSSLLKENDSISSSAYGWIGENNDLSIDSWEILEDIQTNDKFEMILNCDRKTIGLRHERTDEEYEIDIDLSKCPFPWQLYFGLSYWDDSIRILSS